MTRIEVAGRADAAVVGRLLAQFNAEFDTPSPTAEQFAARFARLLAREDVLVLLAASDEEFRRAGDTVSGATGFAFITLRSTPYYDGPLAQLEELYVVPSLRDRGIGTLLLRAALEAVRGRGAGEMHINVDEVDTDTRRFYERHGFTNIEADGRMLCYVQELPPPSDPPERP